MLQFADLHLEMRSGKLGLDFTQFDSTVSSTGVMLTHDLQSGFASKQLIRDASHERRSVCGSPA